MINTACENIIEVNKQASISFPHFFGGGETGRSFVSESKVFVCVCTSSHRIEVVEEAHAVRGRGLHGELQEGLHVQVGLDHCGGPQESRHRCPGPVYASYTEKDRDP